MIARGSPDWVARGLPTGGQRSKVYVLCAEPKEHKHFRPGTRPGGWGARPGGSVTGVTEKLFMCQTFMCLFRPLDNNLFLLRYFSVLFAQENKERQGKQESIHTTTVATLFSRSVTRPRGHRAKKSYGAYHVPGKTREKGIHHRSGKKGAHHRALRPGKEKRRVSTVCILFSSLRVHAKGVVLCERLCFCLLSAF